ncbi:MAG: Rrf2 family transcriptional regulator [Gemmatimonadetes bacterium]|nr:Rrf2 family transcriptional regulator [Gemmatimonadota bacterium]
MTRTAGYALSAALAVAERGGETRSVSATELANTLEIPSNYLAKILHALARDGILISERGRTGGFRLARAPETIRLLDVVQGFDDLGRERQCLLGRGECTDVGGCPAHRDWVKASAPAFHFFESRSLADLMNRQATTPVDGESNDAASD